ncbi:MAG: hypothetical protein KC418_00140 [Anaerolineales bacterium]|nr:hypothetical protein [Anaerolineales bacterium]MCB8950902.1 hypothetical protein [Ardenticatenales bacterium]
MNKPAKLILRWNIRSELESEYFEFMVSEFIPGTNRLGLTDIQAWYTLYGACEQILFSAVTNTEEEMERILKSESWENLQIRLTDLVTDFSKKVIANATGGFQI